jgi:hypothetical protein
VYFVHPAEFAAPLQSEQAFAFNEDDAPSNFGHYDDFGIGDQAKVNGHWTTVNWCSCQFHLSYFMPCRHTLMLRIRLNERGQRRILLQLIGSKWHRVDDMLRAQQMLRLSSGIAFQRAEVRITYTHDERYSKLMDELRGIAELGSCSMQTFNIALSEIPKLAQVISGSNSHQTSTAARTAQSAVATAGAATAPRAAATQPAVTPVPVTAANATAAAAPGRAVRRTPDYVNFLETVGTRFQLAQKPDEEALKNMSVEGKGLVGSYIASKWETKGRKGWMLGRIQKQLSAANGDSSDDDSSELFASENFFIEYTDGYAMDISLQLGDYCDDVTVNNDQDAWVLLQTPPLSDDVIQLAMEGNLHNPQHFKPTGMGSRGRRLEPLQGGPTGKTYKKNAKQAKTAHHQTQ